MFLKVSQNWQENTCTRVSFSINYSPSARIFIKKETLAQTFSCEFCEISKNTFFCRTPLVAVSPNRGYLHCAILKVLHDFQEKRALKSRDMQFFFQNVPNEIFKISKMLESNMKFTRAACWINAKISNYCWSSLWSNYWMSLQSDSRHQKTWLYLLQWKPFKNDEKCLLIHLKKSPCSQDLRWLFGYVKKVNSKIYDVTIWLTNSCITHIAQYLTK